MATKGPGFERRKRQKSKRAVVERAEGLASNSAFQIHTAAFELQRPIIIDLCSRKSRGLFICLPIVEEGNQLRGIEKGVKGPNLVRFFFSVPLERENSSCRRSVSIQKLSFCAAASYFLFLVLL